MAKVAFLAAPCLAAIGSPVSLAVFDHALQATPTSSTPRGARARWVSCRRSWRGSTPSASSASRTRTRLAARSCEARTAVRCCARRMPLALELLDPSSGGSDRLCLRLCPGPMAQSATHAFLPHPPPPTCRHDRGEAGELLGLVNQADATRNFAGYTDVAATRRKLVRDVLRRGDCWFRTGDLLRTDADGFVYFVDRLGDTFRYKGENVSTAEVAAAIGAIASLRLAQCLVYGVQVLLTTPSPVGCVCPSPPPMDMPRLRRAGAACRWARRHGRAAPRGERPRRW